MLLHHRSRWGKIDAVLLLLLFCAVAYLGYRINAGLEYRWKWQVIPQYLFRHDPVEGWRPNLLVLGLLNTIRLSFWSLVLALPIGLVAGLLRTSLHLFNRLLGGTYVTLLRNLPPLVLIFIFYFFISDQVLPLLNLGEWIAAAPQWLQKVATLLVAPPDQLEAFIAAVVTLALFEGAYIGEIVRAGINSIESGQWEAARALGMRRWQVLQDVILPQAFQLTGHHHSTTNNRMELMAATYLTFEVWITITALYFVLTYSFSWMAGRLELRFQRNYLS